MGCNRTDKQNELRIVRGNTFAVRLEIVARRLNGTIVEDFDISTAQAELKMIHCDETVTQQFTIDGNSIVVHFDATLTLGWYGMEMTGQYNDEPWRWCADKMFQIVETNDKANIPEWSILLDTTYTIDVSMMMTQSQTHGGGAVDSVNGKTGVVVLTAQDVGAMPADTPIPTVPQNLSEFNNDSGFITNMVTDLVNYFTKGQIDEKLIRYVTIENLAEMLALMVSKSDLEQIYRTVTEDGLYFTDDDGNVGASIDATGFHAINLTETEEY